MKAITVRQPWLYAITHLGKRLENRHRTLGPDHRNKPLALHAAKAFDERAIRKFADEGLVPDDWIHRAPRELVRGAVAAVVQVDQVFLSVDRVRRFDADQVFWWSGPCAWHFEWIVPIQPVVCRGNLGLWDLGSRELREVGARFAEAQAAALEAIQGVR